VKGCSRDDYRGVACRADEARESLSFGLSREAAIDTIGRSEVEPPWKNDLGLGPDVITNPFDSEIMKSPLGEEYEVVRFFVESSGNPECPFIQGKLRLEVVVPRRRPRRAPVDQSNPLEFRHLLRRPTHNHIKFKSPQRRTVGSRSIGRRSIGIGTVGSSPVRRGTIESRPIGPESIETRIAMK